MTQGKNKATDQPPVYAGLKVITGERHGFVLYPLKVDTLLGRLSTVQVFMPDVRCSRRHCLIHWNGQAFALVDLSANGTLLNGAKVDKQTETALTHGDRIKCGDTEVEFRVAAQPAQAARGPVPVAPPQGSPSAPAIALPGSSPPLPQPTQPAPPVELVFDFGPDEDPSGGLDKVFFDHDTEQWSSKNTQRIPQVRTDDLSPPRNP